MARWEQGLWGTKVWARDVAFTAAVALTISLIGPYGSYDEPLQQRLVVSFAFGFSSGVWLWPVMRLLLRAGERAGLPELFTMVTGLLILTVPVAAISQGVAWLINQRASNEGPIGVYFAVLAMVLPVGAAYLLVDRLLERPHATVAPSPAPDASPPKLYDRLPPRLGRDILALQAEDHYVRVHTRLGSDLLLMRLADAIGELQGLEGVRVHRSWWVTRDAVTSARAEGRRAVLTLANGAEVPVTRESVPLIRGLGWL